ncbi:hypothetical protein F4604DRAFT_1932000 [Suillus subluteus]|nr:hypothetical protein F4604DRAFT_1932000 [Suillus subluteus]
MSDVIFYLYKYRPIVIPQLWSTCLPSADSNHILQDHVAQIEQLETEKACQAKKKLVDHRALEAAKKQGKEAHTLERAHIAKEKESEAAEKNDARLKSTAAKQAEKARLSAEKKSAKYCKKATNDAMDIFSSDTQPESLPSTAPEVPHMTDTGDDGEEELKFGLRPEDPANLLKLSGALHILMHNTLLDADIDSADTLIWQYVTELLKTNNHRDGELKTTFFSEFYQMCESSRLTHVLLQIPKESLPFVALAALSKELDEVNADAAQAYALSPRHQKILMTLDTCHLLAKTICFCSPLTPVHC